MYFTSLIVVSLAHLSKGHVSYCHQVTSVSSLLTFHILIISIETNGLIISILFKDDDCYVLCQKLPFCLDLVKKTWLPCIILASALLKLYKSFVLYSSKLLLGGTNTSIICEVLHRNSFIYIWIC